jgi:hypothetical protein
MLFQNSNHTDIVAFREAHADLGAIAPPNQTEPAFRLVRCCVSSLPSELILLHIVEPLSKRASS